MTVVRYICAVILGCYLVSGHASNTSDSTTTHYQITKKKKHKHQHPAPVVTAPTAVNPNNPAVTAPTTTNYVLKGNIKAVPVNMQGELAPGPHIMPHVTANGNIRTYFFQRDFSNHNIPNQQAFSLGGKFNVLTDPFLSGFRVGGTLYTAQPLGLNSKSFLYSDGTLPSRPVTVLGQGFLQYENRYSLTRVGDQLITTPWMNEADSRMIPATFQGLYLQFNPHQDLNLIAMRMIRFKPRIASSFTQSNLYTPQDIAGGNITALADKTVIGALAFGATYKPTDMNLEIWGYQFYDYAKLVYADAQYTVPTNTWIRPIVGVQVAGEWNDGSESLARIGHGDTHAEIFGALLGAQIGMGTFTLGFDHMPQHKGSYLDGDVVSPYTITYAADPLFTTSMTAGLIEKAAGTAGKVTAEYRFFDRQLHLLASFARYITTPLVSNTNEEDFDIIYTPNGTLKNLSLRYRIGVRTGNPVQGKFTYSRLMLQYDFD